MRKRIFILLSIACILLVLFTGCSSKRAADSSYSPVKNNTGSVAEDNTAAEQESGKGKVSVTPKVSDNSRKLIRTLSLTIETKEYDKLNNAISKQIFEMNGYIENSESSGNGYNSNHSRSCSMVIRIPKDKLDQFVLSIGDLGAIVNRQETTKDITLAYVDIESHKKALQIQYERLLALLEKADKLEDIITLEKQLSEVRYQIESYESQLRTFDNQVDYATLRLYIQEVERVIKKDDGSIWGKIATGFQKSLVQIGSAIEAFIIWFCSNILYLIIIVGIIVLIVFFIKRKWNTKKNTTPQTPVPTNSFPQNQ